jgi:hypothetical protein
MCATPRDRRGEKLTKNNPVPWPSATALGPYGWVQVVNFALAGVLVLAFVQSFRTVLQGRIGRIAGALLYVVCRTPCQVFAE